MPGFTEAAYTLIQAGAWGAAGGTGATAFTAAEIAAAALTVSSYTYAAYGMVDAQRQQSRARDAANASMTDRLVTVRSASAATRIIYGRTRVAADTIAFVHQHGAARPFTLAVEAV